VHRHALVEFKAADIDEDGNEAVYHELSAFVREQGKWYQVEQKSPGS
jgi:uncharacterized protein YchJ